MSSSVKINKIIQKKPFYFFKKLGPNNVEMFNIIKNYFFKNIEPIYGNQNTALEKIKQSEDRTTVLLFYQNKVSGCIIYKNNLTSEFCNFGFNETLELKTFFLFEKKHKTAGFIIILLLNYLAKIAVSKNAKAIVGTISSKKPEVLKLFKKIGFKVFHTTSSSAKKMDEFFIVFPDPHQLSEVTKKKIKKYLNKNCINLLATS
jgi:hypothetical protein